jgi:hypothetical protein
MATASYDEYFSQQTLTQLFPADRTNAFFEALYGDSSEGAYTIRLVYKGSDQNSLRFEFHLQQRPGKCLACNLTYGLPQVFARHPVINIKSLIQEIDLLLDGRARCADWTLESTQEMTRELHVVPLVIHLGH